MPSDIAERVASLLADERTCGEISRDDCNERFAAAQQAIAALEADNAAKDRRIGELEAKLDFLKAKGLTVTTAKTSDRPEPYLVYVIEEDSELCDGRTIAKLTDAEIKH